MTAGRLDANGFDAGVGFAIDAGRCRWRRLSNSILEANVACGQSSRAARNWPAWLESSSIACFPMRIKCGCSRPTMAANVSDVPGIDGFRHTDSQRPIGTHGQGGAELFVAFLAADRDGQDLDSLWPASRIRSASSSAIASNGFMTNDKPLSSIRPFGPMATRCSGAGTRLIATRIFIRAKIACRIRQQKEIGERLNK